ncbi:MAG TPA: TauD/TfdA family dioxygenase [Allosphingosinicella sp.]|nr:TauD/TfdA family dioxygenase [Allosphingosinicella sp.]
MEIDSRPIGGLPFGVRIRGVTCARLEDEEVRSFLRAALGKYGLLVLEEVELGHAAQALVGEVFGSLKDYRTDSAQERPGRGGDVAEVVTEPGNCTVVEIAGRRLAGWMPWHFDQPYNERPNPARLLRCGRTVRSGGMTGFMDGAELYRRIDPSLRQAIEPCRVDYALDLSLHGLRFGRPAGFRIENGDSAAGAARPPAQPQRASHPAVRAVAGLGKILHLSPWMATGIHGCSDEGTLLEAVAQDIIRVSESEGYFHDWKLSDLLVWDNLRMLHASSGFDPADTRIMYRTTIKEH